MESSLLEAKPSDYRNEEDPNKKLTTKTWQETKKILRVCVPSMVFRVMTFGVLVVTQSCIGHINSVDLAAYALVQSISIRFINGILLGMSTTTETLCGQAFGAKHYHMIGIYLQRSWIIDFVTATILLPILIFSSPIYKLLGQDDDIADSTETISLWFIPYCYTLLFTLTTNMFLQAQMRNLINVWLSSGSMVVHVFFSWLFVYELDLGVPGAMGAMVVSQWGLVASNWIYIFGGWCGETWIGFSKLAFADLVPLIKISISSGFMLCLQLWYTSALVLIAGYSTNAVVEVDAFSICLNINQWEFNIALGLLAATSVRVSNELGRGNVDAAKFAIKVIMCMSVALGLFFCVLCIILGDSYPYWFTSDAEVAEVASSLSLLLALTMLISGFQAVLSGVAIGCGSQAQVAIVNAVSYYIIGVPIGCLLTFVAELGIKGIWIGMLAGMVVQIIALVAIQWRMDWKEEVNKTEGRLGRFHRESIPQGESDQILDHE